MQKRRERNKVQPLDKDVHVRIRNEYMETANVLIKAGSDVNVKDDEYDNTALQLEYSETI